MVVVLFFTFPLWPNCFGFLICAYLVVVVSSSFSDNTLFHVFSCRSRTYQWNHYRSVYLSCISIKCFLGKILGVMFVYADCGNNDPELKEEMEKDIVTLLAEEVRLQKMVANESLEHTKSLIVSARKASLQYQSEAEKCNAGMEICEEARERAMKELMEERRLTELWQNRALEFGWKDV